MFLPQQVRMKDGRTAEVRPASAADAEAVIALVNGVGAEEVYIMTETLGYTVEEERKFLDGIDGRTMLFVVAVLEGAVVGSMNFARGRSSKNAHTASLGISLRKDVRGQGLGRAMMEAGIRWAESVGIRKLTLGVFATNERAVALYRNLGFVEEGRLKGEVLLRGQPVDELLMSKWL